MWAFRSLFLCSNSKLQNAVPQYEFIGFRHAAAESIPGVPYVCAKVFMDLSL